MNTIIIGATSGIGEALASLLVSRGHTVGICGRRNEYLVSIRAKLGARCFTQVMDVKNPEDAVPLLNNLIVKMNGVDCIVISAGVGSVSRKYSLEEELDTVRVNVLGFTAIANAAYHYFVTQKKGHIVGISSVAAERGGPFASYNASKAYVSSFLEGLSCRRDTQNYSIYISDIRPGFVDTDMAKGDGIFWCAPVEKAARQILSAIEKRKRIVYVTKRWRFVAALIRLIPSGLYRTMMKKA